MVVTCFVLLHVDWKRNCLPCFGCEFGTIVNHILTLYVLKYFFFTEIYCNLISHLILHGLSNNTTDL